MKLTITPFEREELSKLLNSIDVITGAARANFPQFTGVKLEVIGERSHCHLVVSATMLARLAGIGRDAIAALEKSG